MSEGSGVIAKGDQGHTVLLYGKVNLAHLGEGPGPRTAHQGRFDLLGFGNTLFQAHAVGCHLPGLLRLRGGPSDTNQLPRIQERRHATIAHHRRHSESDEPQAQETT